MRTCSIHFSFRKGYANLVVSVWQLSLEHPLEMGGGRRRRRRSELMHGEEDKWAHAWGHDVHGELSLEKIWNKCHRAWHILISSSSHFHILRTNHPRHVIIYIYIYYLFIGDSLFSQTGFMWIYSLLINIYIYRPWKRFLMKEKESQIVTRIFSFKHSPLAC